MKTITDAIKAVEGDNVKVGEVSYQVNNIQTMINRIETKTRRDFV